MSIEKIAEKFGVAAVVNAIAGAKVLGVGAAIHSEPIGGYGDPNQINGYTYNPADGKWYKSPSAPDYGQYGWLEPADSSMAERLVYLWLNMFIWWL
ncbi:hypothetical protein [Pseudomonas lopnurensis]|uniref:hypothetical protein n=1 Tax=Pseudomonas lopnurensis TaxID=1477517 RepID=UPI001879AEEC|nr:hypothetical protein [Pseudomonas lopnurensis]MBE7375049.1 hypothetical protein [Pseudomonas lopnurensis]